MVWVQATCDSRVGPQLDVLTRDDRDHGRRPPELPVRPGPPSPAATVLWIGCRIYGGPAMLRIDVSTLINRPVQ